MAAESTVNLDTELKQRLIDSLDKVEEWIKAGEGFAKEQAPLVVQDIVNWGVYGHGVFATIALAGVLMAIVGMTYCCKKSSKIGSSDMNGFDFGLICFFVVFFVSVVTASLNISPALKASIAPRIYVLEQLGVLK